MAQVVAGVLSDVDVAEIPVTSGTIDTDVHPYVDTIDDLIPYLSARWVQ